MISCCEGCYLFAPWNKNQYFHWIDLALYFLYFKNTKINIFLKSCTNLVKGRFLQVWTKNHLDTFAGYYLYFRLTRLPRKQNLILQSDVRIVYLLKLIVKIDPSSKIVLCLRYQGTELPFQDFSSSFLLEFLLHIRFLIQIWRLFLNLE